MQNIPSHLGVILDGNRRWAEEQGLPIFEGHRRGLEKARLLVKWCAKKGIETLTLFVFSTENWKRTKTEVNHIMSLLEKALGDKSVKEANEDGIRIKIIGQKEKLPKALQKRIIEVEKSTQKNKNITVNFALSYGGRAEIVDAIKNIIKKKISPDKITEHVIKENLSTSDVDLVIRTGKEQRISNFLIWQAAYSELYFCPKYWPDFIEEDLDKAILDYQNRQRRVGK